VLLLTAAWICSRSEVKNCWQWVVVVSILLADSCNICSDALMPFDNFTPRDKVRPCRQLHATCDPDPDPDRNLGPNPNLNLDPNPNRNPDPDPDPPPNQDFHLLWELARFLVMLCACSMASLCGLTTLTLTQPLPLTLTLPLTLPLPLNPTPKPYP
jgi:hypothetical protein